MIARLRLLLPTLGRLGPGPVAGVAAYRLACRVGLYARRLPVQGLPAAGDLFSPTVPPAPDVENQHRQAILGRADRLLTGEMEYFSAQWATIGTPPDWFLDPINGQASPQQGHWSGCHEFAGGDIKILWEPSRIDWTLSLAQAWRLSGDRRYLDALNGWLLDWCRRNPANQGPNWKCGQEAAIRGMHLAMTAILLEQHRKPSAALTALVRAHLARIAPTIGYAIAQDNNHGTSEAAALFIGGSWLEAAAADRKGRRWARLGRKWLENRAARLIAADGSFSQHSVNYHRVLLDTLSMVEIWRRTFDLPPFSPTYLGRCRAATGWLQAMVQEENGDAPNLGANDGARLLPLAGGDYRDFRPSVQLASVLFCGVRAYPEGGEWDLPLHWLGVKATDALPAKRPRLDADGGYVHLPGTSTWGLVRFARFRFRPSHADCLHLDLWHRGKNLLRDGGTFSYNTDPETLNYFAGTASHNTVQFDGRDQMPRLGRFLFGAWLQMDEVGEIRRDGEGLSWSGAYTDWQGARHRRTVSAAGDRWRVRDEIFGFREKAVLRWRLAPADWTLAGGECRSSLAHLSIRTDAPIRRLELVTGWESLYYLQKTELPVLEVEVGPGAWSLETEIILKG